MAAVNQTRADTSGFSVSATPSRGPLELIQGSLSSRKVSRQSPFLAGLHRSVDGALSGVLIAVALMATLTLHWQHRWTEAYKRLDTTRTLSNRLTESTAMLERYLLQRASLPMAMVPTKVSNLVYLERPISKSNSSEIGWLNVLIPQTINQGY